MSKVRRSLYLDAELNQSFKMKCIKRKVKDTQQVISFIEEWTHDEQTGPLITERSIRNKIKQGFEKEGIDLDKILSSNGKDHGRYKRVLEPLFQYLRKNSVVPLKKGEK